jgi:hypothetical protein
MDATPVGPQAAAAGAFVEGDGDGDGGGDGESVCRAIEAAILDAIVDGLPDCQDWQDCRPGRGLPARRPSRARGHALAADTDGSAADEDEDDDEDDDDVAGSHDDSGDSASPRV